MIHFHSGNALRILAVAMLLMAGTQARASEVDELRAQLEAMKSEYQARIQALESRLALLEAQAAAAPPAVAEAPLAPPAPAPAPAGGGGSAGNAFNPAVSVILGGRYTQTSADPATYAIAGFIPAGENVGPGSRSFNLDESELTLAANIDPYFFGNLTAAISGDNTISVEEAYVKTLALPNGLLIKGGRFFSGLGYLNEIHSHAWDFVDQPLIYQAMFDGQLAQDGVQLKWLAPTDMFMELGAETGNGDNFPGTHLHGNGLNGVALLAHIGDDVGDSVSWRAGLSWLSQQAENRVFTYPTVKGPSIQGYSYDAFSGDSKTWVADATLKWSPHGNANLHSFKLQAEYMQRTEDGQLATFVASQNVTGAYHSRQSGWYLQGVYQFLPRWRFGVRYDLLDSGDVTIDPVQENLLAHATPS
ncbi:MAG TPA: hypothetical protein VGN77_01425, partial [Steroidobacteraceae bacterium]|nr:hypothetical protein [Steroidobacteraceae bacterium]